MGSELGAACKVGIATTVKTAATDGVGVDALTDDPVTPGKGVSMEIAVTGGGPK